MEKVLRPEDIVITDVGAHQLWTARLLQRSQPNTCIMSNGIQTMGIGVPGAIAAKLLYPKKRVLAVCGDGGFIMAGQELEVAARLKQNITFLIWEDEKYGLIEWHLLKKFGRASCVSFTNPDFVKLAEAFGGKGYRVTKKNSLSKVLKQSFAQKKFSIVVCPVDYRENMKLTNRLGPLVCNTH
jgi:acetolactate synthase-1/2/3 large subunit